MSSAKNIAILTNALAGSGRALALTQKLSDHLRKKNISFTVFDKDWPPLDEYSEAWIVGGDGTVNFFVNRFPNASIPLVIFNGGTGNDVHWLLYGDMSLEEQFIKIETAEATPVDLGSCNDRYFLNGVGIGFEGAVAKDLAGKKKRPGKASFLIAILKRLFFYSSKDYTIRSAEINAKGNYLFIDVANGQRAGGGFHIAPLSAIDDGWLDLVMVNKLHPLWRLRYLPVIEKGKHLALDFVQHHKTTKLLIESDTDMLAHLDGELYIAKSMEIGILKGRLRIKR